MAIVPVGFVNQRQLAAEIDKAIKKVGKDAVRIRYTVGEDSMGDPAIYFRVLLTDAASRGERLFPATKRITDTLDQELRSYENWGLLSYFTFRSESEQKQLNDPDWD